MTSPLVYREAYNVAHVATGIVGVFARHNNRYVYRALSAFDVY